MKFIQKITAIILALLMLSYLVACAKNAPGDSGEATTPDTQATSSPTTPPPSGDSGNEEASVTLTLAQNGYTPYTLVYDDQDAYLSQQVSEFAAFWKAEYGVELLCEPKSTAAANYEKEILVGKVRKCVNRIAKKTADSQDFILHAVKDDLVLYATNSRMYAYLFAYMKQAILPKTDASGTLTFSTEDNFLYQDHPSISNISYVNYLLGTEITWEELPQIFEEKTFTAQDNTTLPYRIYVPAEYDPLQKYPVFTFLHGAGERGTDNVENLRHVIANLFSQADAPIQKAIVICPQCPISNQWVDTPWENGNYSVSNVPESNELKAVMELLEQVEDIFSSDTDRYYVAGLSMGGFATWDLLMRHPDRFAAGIAMCGGADPAMASILKNVPIYTVHGTADPTVPHEGTHAMVEALRAAGSTVIQYEELSGYGHDVWNYTSKKAEIQNWLFQQTKAGRAS